MSKNNDELIACLEQIHAMSIPLGTDAGHDGILAQVTKALELARAEPPRAPPGTFEIGLTPDETEVIMNMPHTPDNGTGFVHFAFTPLQAIAAGELLIKKGKEAAPKAGMQAARAVVREMHTHVWEADPVSGAAVCKCGTHADAWFCPTSPDKLCHYERGKFDSCIHCGQPEERK